MDFAQQQASIAEQQRLQRIMELQMVQQRQLEMLTQNQSRFSEMRDRLTASMMPFGGMPVPGDMGLFGRQITAFNSAPSRQSLFGVFADNQLVGNPLFMRAGFQFGINSNLIQQRAAQQLRVFGNQMGNVALNAVTPTVLQRMLGRVGFEDIQESSLAITDTFANIRSGSDTLDRRGVSYRRAAREQERFVTGLNRRYGGALNADEIRTLGDTAISSADLRQLSAASTEGPGGISRLMAEQVRLLESIVRNTGISQAELKELSRINRGLGNTVFDLAGSSGVISSLRGDNIASRARQLQTAIQLTAQGRQLNMADAGAFGADQMTAINDLVQNHLRGIISRASLFRFGGEDEFEAAARVQQQMIQQGTQFARTQTARFGVLGPNALGIQRRGLLATNAAVGAAYARNPFADVEARFNYTTQQQLTENASAMALAEARSLAAFYPATTGTTKTAIIKDLYGQLLGLPDLEAGRQVDDMINREAHVASILQDAGVDDQEQVDRVMTTLTAAAKRTAVSVDMLINSPEIMRAAAQNIPEGVLDRLINDKFTNKNELAATVADIVNKKGEAYYFSSTRNKQGKQTKLLGKQLIQGRMYVYADGPSEIKDDKEDLAIYALYQQRAISQTDLAEIIYRQSESDQVADFKDSEEVLASIKKGDFGNVFGKLSTEQSGFVVTELLKAINNRNILNLQANKRDGSSYDKALWVELKEK